MNKPFQFTLPFAGLMTALQVGLTSWFSFFPQASFVFIFFIPLFSIYVIYHTRWKGWLLYFLSVTFIQLFLFTIAWDWYFLFIFPSMILGLYLGLITHFSIHESIIFFGGTLIQMLLFLGVNGISDQLYNVNYTILIQSIFSIALGNHVNVLYLGLYIASLLQFFLSWLVFRYMFPFQKIMSHQAYNARDSIFIITLSLLIYVVFYVVLDLPFLWLIGPLMFLSVMHSLYTWLSLSRASQSLIVVLGLLYPLIHALIATYTSLWAFPLSLLWFPFLALLMTVTSRSPSQAKIG